MPYPRRAKQRFPTVATLAAVFLAVHAALPGGWVEAAELRLPQRAIGEPFRGAVIGAQTPDQAYMRIDQTADRAVLHWQRFDIGSRSHVEFRQPSTEAIALNRIVGGGKSVIDGRLTANGRVFLINQNGILFGDHARVNVHSLVASTLDIDDSIFEGVGFVNAIREGTNGLPAFENPGGAMGSIECARGCTITSGEQGRILVFAPEVVNRGTLSSPQGQVVLASAEDRVYVLPATQASGVRGLQVEVGTGSAEGGVKNLGTILAEQGNVSLVGLSVNQSGIVRATTGVALNGSVQLLAQDMNSGVANSNAAEAVRAGTLYLGAGSVTEVVPSANPATALDAQVQPTASSQVRLVGKTVTVDSGAEVRATGGLIQASAVNNPSLDELGSPSDPTHSEVEIRIDQDALLDVSGDDTSRVSVARNFIQVEARGNELADSPLQRDGPIRSKTLTVDLRKGTDFLDISGATGLVERDVRERLSPGGAIVLESEGRVHIAPGAVLDISGGQVTYTGASVATTGLVTRNGEVVDISEADPEVAYAGVFGELEIEHEKWGVTEVFTSPLSRFEPGYVEGKDAGALRITAPEVAFGGDLVAGGPRGIHQRWLTRALGDAPAFTRAYDQVPHGGELVIQRIDLRLPDLVVGSGEGLPAPDNDHPEAEGPALVLAPGRLEGSGVSRVELSNLGRVLINRPLDLPPYGELELSATQVGVYSDLRVPGGQVEVYRQLLPAEGRSPLDMDAAALARIDAVIDVSGTWVNDSPLVNARLPTAPIIPDGGAIRIGRALAENGVARGAGDDQPALTEVLLSPGSRLDVSGGAHLSAGGEFSGGRGGEVVLHAGTVFDDTLSNLHLAGELRGFGMGGGGRLELRGPEFRILPGSASPAPGGALDGAAYFTSRPVDVAEDALYIEGLAPLDAEAAALAFGIAEGVKRNAVFMDAGAFAAGGFQDFQLTAERGAVSVLPGARVTLRSGRPFLDPVRLSSGGNLLANAVAGPSTAVEHPAAGVPSADAIDDFTRIEVPLPDERTPSNLSLRADATALGRVYVGTGAAIRGDPGAEIGLQSRASLLVNGTIEAPAGRIRLAQTGAGGPTWSFLASRKVWLGPASRLGAPGAVRLDAVRPFGRMSGEVLDAGRVEVRADQGAIIGAAGAVIDVEGASTELDLGLAGVGARRVVAGRAGTIALSAAEGLVYAGTLSGRSVANGPGGTLEVTLDPNTRGSGIPGNLAAPFVPPFDLGPHIAVMGAFDGELPGPAAPIDDALLSRAYVPPQQVTAGGLDSLRVTVRGLARVGGTRPETTDSLAIVQFAAGTRVSMAGSLVLDAPVLRAEGAGEVRLEAPYVALGSGDPVLRYTGSFPFAVIGEDGKARRFDGDFAEIFGPLPGPATLRVDASHIDVVGELVTQGFGATEAVGPGVRLHGDGDLRLRGVRQQSSLAYTGLLRTWDGLQVETARVYPTTLSDFRLTAEGPDGVLRFDGLATDSEAAPVSVAGRLTLEAEVIEQYGRVYAPLGQVVLHADRSVTLGPRSLTSTSGKGVAAPFFGTEPGGDLVLPGRTIETSVSEFTQNNLVFVEEVERDTFQSLLPEQAIEVRAPAIDLREGARVDLRGGSEVRATEFVPGPGGSRDILLADLNPGSAVVANPSFAILPGVGEYAPYDPWETPAAEAAQGFSVGDTLVLEEEAPGLPAGEYAILPPRYALFGGYLVTPMEGTRDLLPGAALSRPDGSPILAGRFGVAGNGRAASRSQGFGIEDGAAVRNRAEYAETALGAFYTGGELRPPGDAGRLTLEAESRLRLAGSLVRDRSPEGLGAQVDILADTVTLREQTAPGGGVELLASQLQGLNAASIVVGARRSLAAGEVVLTPQAEATTSVTVEAGTGLDLPELILVADRVDVQGHPGVATTLASSGPASGLTRSVLLAGNPGEGVNGDAAVVAVSNRTLDFARGGTTGTNSGNLVIAPQAVLEARGSVVADVAGDADVAGSIRSSGGQISLGASAVELGEIAGQDSGGLKLSNEALTRLAGSNLVLRSGAAISLFGAVGDRELLFERLTLDAAALVGTANGGRTARLAAASLELRNTSGEAQPDSGLTPAGGALDLSAARVELGGGAVKVQGFGEVSLTARDHVLLQDSGAFHAEAPLSLSAPLIAAAGGVDYRLAAAGASLSVTGARRGAPLPAGTGLGAALRLEGTSVDFRGRAELPSGLLDVRADGDLTVAGDALLNVAGVSAVFGSAVLGTPGGGIELTAESGSLRLADTARLDVSASLHGGEGGWVTLRAPQGQVAVSPGAELASGNAGGELTIDAGTLIGPTAEPFLGRTTNVLDTGLLLTNTVDAAPADVPLARTALQGFFNDLETALAGGGPLPPSPGEVAPGIQLTYAGGLEAGGLTVTAVRQARSQVMGFLDGLGIEAYATLQDRVGGDFSARRALRLRDQGIAIPAGQTLRAHVIRLVSDADSVTIDGTLDASGQGVGTVTQDGGEIVLAAGDSVVIGPAAELRATGAPADGGGAHPAPGTRGGSVEFFALDADGSDPLGATDRVHLRSGAMIDVRGGVDDALPALPALLGVGGTTLELAATEALKVASRVELEETQDQLFLYLDALVEAHEAGDAAPPPPVLIDGLSLAGEAPLSAAAAAGAKAEFGTFLEAFAAPTRRAPRELGGELLVHTRRLDTDGNRQTDLLVSGDLDATILGAYRTEVVATRVLQEGEAFDPGDALRTLDVDRDLDPADADPALNAVSITSGDIDALRGETAAFLAGEAETVEGFPVVPGIEIRTPNHLVLEDEWDFFPEGGRVGAAEDAWHFGLTVAGETERAGSLTLRAGGDLELRADLSDSFADVPGVNLGFFGSLPTLFDQVDSGIGGLDGVGNVIVSPPVAWSYRLSGGADLASADPEGTAPGEARVALTGGAVLRTGTGNIRVNASGDVALDAGSAIYTGGYNPGLSESVKGVLPPSFGGANAQFARWLGAGAQFPRGGGDLYVAAGGDISAAQVPSLPTVWQPRIGEPLATTNPQDQGNGLILDSGAVPTHWGVAFQRFGDGIGALGGGRLQVRAGGDLVDLALAVPTNGRAVTGAAEDPLAPSNYAEALETTEVGGGGLLVVDAGGDVRGGSLHLGDGRGRVRAGGALAVGTDGVASRFYNGFDSRLEVQVRGGAVVAGIQDSTTVGLSPTQASYEAEMPFGRNQDFISNVTNYMGSLFYTYGSTAGVAVSSLAGDVHLSSAGRISPRLALVSHGGDALIDSSVNLYPSPEGQVDLFAHQSVQGLAGTTLTQSDQEARLLASIDTPSEQAVGELLDHAPVPVHSGDPQPNRFVARHGSIAASGGDVWALDLAKASIFEAGLDLEGLKVQVQNIQPYDVSAFVAGRDIRQPVVRNSTGGFEFSASFAPRYEISGPGTAQFVAARRVSLGTSEGIETIGNGENLALPDLGASLLLMAGLGEEPDYLDFVADYVAVQEAEYRPDLAAFLAEQGVSATGQDLVDAFASLTLRQQRLFAAEVLLNELLASGLEATGSGSEDYSRGFAAIQALFPRNDPDGGISLLLSQVQTLDGGDIRILVPGGKIDAGTANADIFSTFSEDPVTGEVTETKLKEAADLGIVAARDGDIGVFVDRDLLVNSTRVFALQGDLMVWSSNGSIDAGKGAKTVTSVPDPVSRINEEGQLVTEFPPAVEGSGLQGVNAFLFAPRGVVNAGDAGIRATGNLTIGATEVLGADNIDVGGVSVGVPTGSVAPPPAVPTQDNVASRATKEVTEQAAESSGLGGSGPQPLSIISVNVLGFGE